MTTTVAEKNLTNKAYTVEEFKSLPYDGNSYELVEGKLVEKGRPRGRKATLIHTLGRGLSAYVNNHELGQIISNTTFALELATALRPDLAFVSHSRPTGAADEILLFAPELVVEVLDTWNSGLHRAEKYLRAGVQLVWLLDPLYQEVSVYRPNGSAALWGGNEVLSGENALPGFTLKVSEIFG